MNSAELHNTILCRKEVEEDLDRLYQESEVQHASASIKQQLSILLEEHDFLTKEIHRLKKGVSPEVYYKKR